MGYVRFQKMVVKNNIYVEQGHVCNTGRSENDIYTYTVYTGGKLYRTHVKGQTERRALRTKLINKGLKYGTIYNLPSVGDLKKKGLGIIKF